MNLFSQGIPLGRWFGTRVVLGFTHLIVLYILVEDIPDRTMAVIAAISLFISVLLHEFGHAFACKGVGGTADLIILGPMGGQTTTRAPSFPIPQFVITAGGLAVTALLWGICWLLLQLPAVNAFFQAHPDPAYRYLEEFIWVTAMWNQVLLVLNILPIWPMDGGRLLQQVLWFSMGLPLSMRISGVVGMLGGAGLVVLGLGIWHIQIPVIGEILGSGSNYFLIIIGLMGAMQSFAVYKASFPREDVPAS
jgi:Zn-dependent protease